MSFDLDAVIAEEAKGDTPEPFTFTFDGGTYTLPGRLDYKVLSNVDEGRFDLALKSLAGPQQWAKIETATKILTIQTMNNLLAAWVEHCHGVNLGKSSGSGAPSKRTRQPSKRTSRASTGSASLKSVRKR